MKNVKATYAVIHVLKNNVLINLQRQANSNSYQISYDQYDHLILSF